jgi:hypothetical protein
MLAVFSILSNPQIALIGPPDYKELRYLGQQLEGTVREVKNIRDVL